MIRQAKRALVTVALVITTSCSGLMVSDTPVPALAETLHIAHTIDTRPLINQVVTPVYQANTWVQFNLTSGQHSALINQYDTSSPFYLITHHRPTNQEDLIWSAPLVQDALVFVVHPDNPINDMSIEHIRQIYRGFETNWATFTDYSADISLYSREDGAAIRLEFNRLVMGQQRTSTNAQVLASSELIREQVANDTTAIGYLPLSLVDDSLKVVSINGILPSSATISANTYPLRLTVYAVGNAPPIDNYQRFIATIQGQILQETLSAIYAPLPR